MKKDAEKTASVEVEILTPATPKDKPAPAKPEKPKGPPMEMRHGLLKPKR